MEGRIPHVTDDPPTFEHHQRSPSPPPERPLPPPPGLLPPPPSGTYIIQIPRDQIYRVPPAENAKIVERLQKPTKPKKEKKGRGKCFLWIFLSIAIVAVIIGVIVGVILPLSNPKPPEFSINKIHVTFTSTPSPKKPAHADAKYDITLKATNQNAKMGVSYEKGGKTSLSSATKEIASGNYPSSSQEAEDSSNIEVTLTGPKDSLPGITMKHNATKLETAPVDLSLTFNVPVKMTGSISPKNDLKVTCSLRVSHLAAAFGTKIVSQDCNSKF